MGVVDESPHLQVTSALHSLLLLVISKISIHWSSAIPSTLGMMFNLDAEESMCSWILLRSMLPLLTVSLVSMWLSSYSLVIKYIGKLLEFIMIIDYFIIPSIAPLKSLWPILLLIIANQIIGFTISVLDGRVYWSETQKKSSLRFLYLYVGYPMMMLLITLWTAKNVVNDIYYYGRLYGWI